MQDIDLVKEYLRGHLHVSLIGEVAEIDEQMASCQTLEDITSLVKSVKPISIGTPDIVRNYVAERATLEAHISAESYLRRLRDILFPHNRNLVMCKIDTGGLSGYSRRLGALGETTYPILQVTLKVCNYPAFRQWIKPNKADIDVIDPSTKRYLESRSILQQAIAEGVTIEEAQANLIGYLKSCDIKPSNPQNDNHVQLVVASADMYRAFLNTQLGELASYFSPKYVDITPYNTVLEAMGRYEEMCYARFEKDSIKYVEQLEDFIQSSSI